MKAKPSEDGVGFKPVSITVTFDTYDEAQRVHDIFNSIEILDSCNNLNGEPIRRAIETALGKESRFQTTTWEDFYEKMKSIHKRLSN